MPGKGSLWRGVVHTRQLVDDAQLVYFGDDMVPTEQSLIDVGLSVIMGMHLRAMESFFGAYHKDPSQSRYYARINALALQGRYLAPVRLPILSDPETLLRN